MADDEYKAIFAERDQLREEVARLQKRIDELECLSRVGVELVLGNIDLDPAALKAWARWTEKVLPDAD